MVEATNREQPSTGDATRAVTGPIPSQTKVTKAKRFWIPALVLAVLTGMFVLAFFDTRPQPLVATSTEPKSAELADVLKGTEDALRREGNPGQGDDNKENHQEDKEREKSGKELPADGRSKREGGRTGQRVGEGPGHGTKNRGGAQSQAAEADECKNGWTKEQAHCYSSEAFRNSQRAYFNVTKFIDTAPIPAKPKRLPPAKPKTRDGIGYKL